MFTILFNLFHFNFLALLVEALNLSNVRLTLKGEGISIKFGEVYSSTNKTTFKLHLYPFI